MKFVDITFYRGFGKEIVTMSFVVDEVVSVATLTWDNDPPELRIDELASDLAVGVVEMENTLHLIVPTMYGDVTVSGDGVMTCRGKSIGSVQNAIHTAAMRVKSISPASGEFISASDSPLELSHVTVSHVRGKMTENMGLEPLKVFNKLRQTGTTKPKVVRGDDGVVFVTFLVREGFIMEVHANGVVGIALTGKHLSKNDMWSHVHTSVRSAVADLA